MHGFVSNRMLYANVKSELPQAKATGLLVRRTSIRSAKRHGHKIVRRRPITWE